MNTTERLTEIIGGVTFNAEAAHKIASEFVLIPRTELPEVIAREDAESLVTNDGTGCVHFLDNDGWPASRHRKEAYARLALADAVDARNADLKVIAAAELAADNDKLDAEALQLWKARFGDGEPMRGQWLETYRILARASRKIHGVTK